MSQRTELVGDVGLRPHELRAVSLSEMRPDRNETKRGVMSKPMIMSGWAWRI